MKRHAALALCLLLLTALSAQNAATVSASVTGKCSTSGGTLAFGPYSPLSGSAVDVTGSLTVQCTRGTPSVTITLDNGSNSARASGGMSRAMSGGGSYLPYEIYTSSAHTTVWNASNSVSYSSTSMAAKSISVYGHIPASEDVSAGSYSDSVTATVNF